MGILSLVLMWQAPLSIVVLCGKLCTHLLLLWYCVVLRGTTGRPLCIHGRGLNVSLQLVPQPLSTYIHHHHHYPPHPQHHSDNYKTISSSKYSIFNQLIMDLNIDH